MVKPIFSEQEIERRESLKKNRPSIVFHLAATVGGIGVNQRNPGKFFYENAVMNLQVIHNAYLTNVEKIISIGTVSVYPEDTPIPFEEKNIWTLFWYQKSQKLLRPTTSLGSF